MFGRGFDYSKVLSPQQDQLLSEPRMNLTPRQALMQFGHVLQQHLFPYVEAAVVELRAATEINNQWKSLIIHNCGVA